MPVLPAFLRRRQGWGRVGGLGAPGLPLPHSEFKTRLFYRRCCLKTQQNRLGKLLSQLNVCHPNKQTRSCIGIPTHVTCQE